MNCEYSTTPCLSGDAPFRSNKRRAKEYVAQKRLSVDCLSTDGSVWEEVFTPHLFPLLLFDVRRC